MSSRTKPARLWLAAPVAGWSTTCGSTGYGFPRGAPTRSPRTAGNNSAPWASPSDPSQTAFLDADCCFGGPQNSSLHPEGGAASPSRRQRGHLGCAVNHIADADCADAPPVGVQHDDVVVPAVRHAATHQLQCGQCAGAGVEYPGLVTEPSGFPPGAQPVTIGSADGEQEPVAV